MAAALNAASTPGPCRVPPLERLSVLALATVFLYLAMFREGTFIYLFHKTGSGVWIDEGLRAADGELIYRDFFETIGPGLVYLNAALARAFGAGLDTFAYAGLALGVWLTAALHALAGRVVAARWRMLPPLLFVVLVYPPFDLGHTRWPALLLGILGVGRAATAAGFRRSAEAGLALGAASLFDREVGLGLALGVLAHLAASGRGRGTSLAGFGAGALAPILLVMGGFAAAAGPDTLLEAWVLRAWSEASDRRSWQPFVSWGPRSIGYHVMALAGLASGVRLLWPRLAVSGREARALRCIGAAGLGLLCTSLLGEVDPYALAHRATLLSVVLAHELAGLHASSGTRAWLARGLLGVLLPGLVHGSAGLLIRRQWIDPLIRQRFRGGETWISAPNPELPWLESHTRPGDFTFVFPAGGHSYGLTRTRNATSFACLIEGRATEEQQRRALAEIAARRPEVGLWWTAHGFPDVSTTLHTLYRGLLQDYEVERLIPNRSLLLRRRLREPARDAGHP